MTENPQHRPLTGFRTSPVSVATPVVSAVLDTPVLTEKQRKSEWSKSSEGRVCRLLPYQHLHSPVKSLRYCQRSCIPNHNPVYDHNGISGLISCSSSLCVKCGRAKQEETADFVERIIRKTNDKYDYFIGTLTFSTDCSFEEQTKSLQIAYASFVKNLRAGLRYWNIPVSIAWSNDATFDTITHKGHFHRHFIARVPKGDGDMLYQKMFSCWQRAVRTKTNRSVVEAAFKCDPIESAQAASKYLYKATREASVHTNKNLSGQRLSITGLLEAISNGAEHLIKIYQRAVKAMKGKRFFGIPTSWKVEDAEIQDVVEVVESEKDDKRIITPIEGTPQIHSAIMESGAYTTLMYVLKTKRDGDKEVEDFRNIVEYWKPLLYRGNKQTSLIDDAAKDFYDWAEDIQIF